MADVSRSIPLTQEPAMQETLLVPAIVSLAGCVAYLFRQISSQHKETKDSLKKCEDGHDETQRQMLGITREIGELKGHRTGVEELAAELLKKIKKE